MKRRKQTQYLHEGRYVAEVAVALREDASAWLPSRRLEDAYKQDASAIPFAKAKSLWRRVWLNRRVAAGGAP